MSNKGWDLIVVNKINKKNNVFNSEFNKVSIINKSMVKNYNKMTKKNVAKVLINTIINDFVNN